MGTLNSLSKDDSFFSRAGFKSRITSYSKIKTFLVVEAWSKVGLRGYHSNQKIIEQASMKVECLLEGMRDATRKSKSEKGTERERARNERQRKRKGKETRKMRKRS